MQNSNVSPTISSTEKHRLSDHNEATSIKRRKADSDNQKAVRRYDSVSVNILCLNLSDLFLFF